jgi:hypothetical protein
MAQQKQPTKPDDATIKEVKQIIKQIGRLKEKAAINPSFVTDFEIMAITQWKGYSNAVIKNALNYLYTQGHVKVSAPLEYRSVELVAKDGDND